MDNHPTTAMEAWQAAKNAEERVFAEEMARTDNGVLAGAFGEKAACAILEAWKDEQVRELRENAKANNALARHETAGRKAATWRAAMLGNALEALIEAVERGDVSADDLAAAHHLLAGERGE